MPDTQKKKVIIGASGTGMDGWVSTDIEVLNLLKEEDWQVLFHCEGSVDVLMAEHVWEHLSLEEGNEAAKRCYRYLKPGGYLRAAVPDGFFPDTQYIEYVKPNGTGAGSDDHKVLYNYRNFAAVFESAGFKVVLLEYFNENGEFIAQDWKPADGLIRRSYRFDERNKEGMIKYTSIVIDAIK